MCTQKTNSIKLMLQIYSNLRANFIIWSVVLPLPLHLIPTRFLNPGTRTTKTCHTGTKTSGLGRRLRSSAGAHGQDAALGTTGVEEIWRGKDDDEDHRHGKRWHTQPPRGWACCSPPGNCITMEQRGGRGEKKMRKEEDGGTYVTAILDSTLFLKFLGGMMQ